MPAGALRLQQSLCTVHLGLTLSEKGAVEGWGGLAALVYSVHRGCSAAWSGLGPARGNREASGPAESFLK